MNVGEGKNVKFIAHCDMEGRGDAVQLVYYDKYLYVGHLWSGGVDIMDVSDPKNPKVVAYVPSPNSNTWASNIQVADDLLLVADEIVLFGGDYDKPWSSALNIYDVSNPVKPRKLSRYPMSGRGPHRMWYVGGKYAFIPAIPEGFERCIFTVFDIFQKLCSMFVK